jgi:Mrp family chromosome partitioning ATPase
MDPVVHFQAIWKRKWVVLALSLAVGGGVYVWSGQKPKVYASSAVVDTLAGATEGGNAPSPDIANIITSRNAALVGTTSLQRRAIQSSGLDISTAVAASRLATVTSGNPGFLEITATGPTPQEARDLARGAAQALVEVNEGVANRVRLVSSARLPDGPHSPRPTRDALFGFLVALVVNAELAALLGNLTRRIRPGSDAEELARLGAPIITQFPRRRQREAIQAFWELRAIAELAQPAVRSLAIVEERPGSYGTLVAVGLAQAIANTKTSVNLVDANLRNPSIGAAIGLAEQGGLADALRGSAVGSVLSAVNPLQPRYRALVAGGVQTDPPGRLGSGAFQRVLKELQDEADVTVVLTAPASAGVDAFVTVVHCDAIILVLDTRRVTRRDVEALVERLDQIGGRVLGSVATYVKLPREQRRRLRDRTT